MDVKIKRIYFINTLLLFISVFVLLIPALKNGYPILFSDSGTYLSSGHSGYVPVDRPILYGIFVRHISLSWSVWLVILMQSILFNYFLYLISKFIVVAKKPIVVQTVMSLILALGTGIGYYVSIVLADIFASISVLCLFFLLTIDKKERFHIIVLSILLILSIGVHLSHIPLIAGTSVLVGVYLFFAKREAFKGYFNRVVYAGGLAVSTLLLLATINYSYDVGFKVSRTNNIILATRYIESGIANRYLKQHCGDPDFNPPYANLCNYTDKFGQWYAAGNYLYEDNSPLYDGPCIEQGWTNCWIEKNEAYSQLVKDILSEKEFRNDFFALAVTGTLKQFFTFDQTHLIPLKLEHIIKRYYEDDLYQYQNSTQYKETLTFEQSSLIEIFVFNISLILLLVIFFKYWNRLKAIEKLFILSVFLCLLVNAFVTATLSNVIPRYQGRLSFLLPLAVMTVAFRVLNEKRINVKLEF